MFYGGLFTGLGGVLWGAVYRIRGCKMIRV